MTVQRPKDLAGAREKEDPALQNIVPGEGTDIIDHELDLAPRFYKPITPQPLSAVLAFEKEREKLRIYRDNPEKEIEMWEGGIPRFIRVPMHMLIDQADSRNPDMRIGPVLHDSKTGVSLRILGVLRPHPEQAILEDQLSRKIMQWAGRGIILIWLVTIFFMAKVINYMATRTMLRNQGVMNPILPQNRLRTLEIIYYARSDFRQYQKDFIAFQNDHWIPYRRSRLLAEKGEEAASEVESIQRAVEKQAKEEQPGLLGRLFGKQPAEDKDKSTIRSVFVPELGKTVEVDTSRAIIGMSPTGPVYAPPDAEILDPSQLGQKMRKLKNKIVAKLDEDSKMWTAKSYDDRARELADEFVVQFHSYLRERGRITNLTPEMVDNLYDLQSIPRIQDLDSYSASSSGKGARPELVQG